MASQTIALGVQNPQMNALGGFADAARAKAGIEGAKIEQAEKSLQMIGAASMHALGGDINGQPDPARFEEGLDMLEGQGIDVSKFRGKPQMANIAARASVTTMQQLQQVQNEREFEMLMQKFGQSLMESDRDYALQREKLDFEKSKAIGAESPLGKLKSDLNAGLISQEEYDAAVQKANAIKGGITVEPDGTVTVGGSLTEGQAKAAGYAQRMENAERELETVIHTADPGKSSANPMSGDFWEMLNRKYGPNMTQSPEYQRFVNGAREWVRAKLRKESGAAISNEEWKTEFETYFPQPGDGPDVIEQKKRLRDNAFVSVKGESRGGYDTLFGGSKKKAAEQPEQSDGGAPVYATNPKTGERLMLQDGQWVPAQ